MAENQGNSQKENTYDHPHNDQFHTTKDIFKKLRRAEIWMICLTALIVIVGGLQWDMMRRQLNQLESGSDQTDRLINEANRIANSMDKTLEQSKEAIGKSLDQSKTALKASVEISRRDQRAWLGPIEVKRILKDETNKPVLLKEGSPPRFKVLISNTGKTPAFRVKTKTEFKTVPSGTKFSATYEVSDRSQINSVAVIQPQMHFTLDVGSEIQRPTPPAIIDAIRTEKIILYLYGKITYDDVFNEPHSTTFCMSLTPSLDSFISCDTYNDAN